MFRVRDTSFQQNPVHKESESESETECVEEKKTEKKTSKNKNKNKNENENENAKISNSSGFQMKYDHTNQCDHF